MKICYFGPALSIHMQRWVKYFAERGHEVYLISFEDRKIENVNVYDVGPRVHSPYFSTLLTFIFRIRRIKRLIKEIKPDILHGHFLTYHAFFAAASGFRPLVVSAWGSDVLVAPKSSFINKLIVKYTLKKSDIILTEAKVMKKEIERYGNALNIKVIPWGVDIDMFNSTAGSNTDIKNLKRELLLDNSPVIISTRPFFPVYNIETLVKAIPHVIMEEPDTRFILKGHESRGGMEQLKERVIGLTRDLNVLESVRFVGKIEHKEMPKYLNAADIYVSTSLSDSCSISMLEAMACGLPVVVSDEPSNLEWIKDGYNGYIFPRKNYKKLAERLIMLLKDKEKRELFGKRNRKIIEAGGECNKNMEKVEQLYSDLINKDKK